MQVHPLLFALVLAASLGTSFLLLFRLLLKKGRRQT